MASILLPVEFGTPDGTNPPSFSVVAGSETAPAKSIVTADFDASTDELLWFQFTMPADYSAGGQVHLNWMANATTGDVVWAASIGAVTAGDADTPIEHANAAASTATASTNTTEAYRLNRTTITLANLDGAAAGDEVFLCVYRDANNGSDGLAVDARLTSVEFEYTSA